MAVNALRMLDPERDPGGRSHVTRSNVTSQVISKAVKHFLGGAPVRTLKMSQQLGIFLSLFVTLCAFHSVYSVGWKDCGK